MRKLSIVILLFGSALLSHAQGFIANLDGTQEVPPNTGPLAGAGQADFTLTGTTFSVSESAYVLFAPSPVATLNDGAPGTDGSEIFAFTMSSDGSVGSFSGSVNLTAEEIADLNAGNLYVNISDEFYPNGAIRGEILTVPEPSTLALIGAGSAALLARLRRKGADKNPSR
jgi:hypothetical protein